MKRDVKEKDDTKRDGKTKKRHKSSDDRKNSHTAEKKSRDKHYVPEQSRSANPETETKHSDFEAEKQSRVLVLRSEDLGDAAGGVRCLHEVAYPSDWPAERMGLKKPMPEQPAKEFPFRLDPFQEEAVRCLESQESVLVRSTWLTGQNVCKEKNGDQNPTHDSCRRVENARRALV